MSDEAQQVGFRERLKCFFQERPTKEELIKKGVIKNRPVFGSSLEELFRKTNRPVPEFVKKCIRCIEVENMVTMEGVYRISGKL